MHSTLAEFDAAPGQSETVIRRGKLFSAGSYPDKSFSLTPEEMRDACREFQPVPIEDTHYPSIFDGRLGEIQSIEVDADGKTLRGAVALPRWLHEVFASEPLKVSCNWDRVTKRLKSVALVPNPRISDAALFAAFSAASGNTDEDEAEFDAPGGIHWVTISGAHVPITDKDVGPEHVSQATSRLGIGYHGHTALHAALDAGKIETDAHLYGVIRAAKGHEAAGASEADAYAAAIASHGQEGPSVRITGQGTIKARGMAPLTHQATADLVRLSDAAPQGKEAVRSVREEIGDDRAREAAAHARRLRDAGLLQKAVFSMEAFFSDVSQEERDKMPAEDFGEPPDGFPIRNQGDLDAAAHLIGKAGDPEAVKRRIISIAKRKGLRLPDAWQDGAGFSLARMGRKGNTMSAPRWWGKLAALFTDAGADPEKLKEIEAEFAAESVEKPVEKPPAGADPRDERIKTLEAQFASERQTRLQSEAAAFAKDAIQVQRKALPAEFAALQQQYLNAAMDDAASPREVTFGQDQKGSRTDALRAAVALRPAHQLTEELAGQQLAVLFSGAADEKEKPATIDPEKIYTERRKAQNGKGA